MHLLLRFPEPLINRLKVSELTQAEEEQLKKSLKADEWKADEWKAFYELWLYHSKRLILQANLILLGQEAEVEDVLSKVKWQFIEALQSGPRIQKITQWLIRVTNNACMDVFRRQKKERKLFEKLSTQEEELPHDTSSVLKENRIQLTWPIIEKVLKDYALERRFIIIAFYVGDWGAKKIADICEISENDVYNETAKFRNAIKRELGKSDKE